MEQDVLRGARQKTRLIPRIVGLLVVATFSEMAWAAVPNSSAYLSAGLAMHWDAIDNAGVGQHSADTTTWKDLTGNGFDWTLNPSWCTWTDSQLKTSVTESGSAVTIPGTTTKAYTDFENKITTMEFIFKADSHLSSIVFSPGFANREAGIATLKDQKYIVFWDQSSSTQNMWGVPLDLNEHKYTVVYKRASGRARPNGLVAVYVDGVKVTPTQCGTYLGQTAKPALCGRDTTWSKTVKGYVRALRVYSRPLTDEEIGYNHAIDQIRYYGANPEDVVPEGYELDAKGDFVKKARPVDASAWDDVKVWYKGSCGNAVGTKDGGGADGWSDYSASKMKSIATPRAASGMFDGGSYRWWGYRLHYENDNVRLPYAGIDLGETPCMVYPCADVVTMTPTENKITINGVEMNATNYSYKVGSSRLPNLLQDWPAGVVCSNYTAVIRFKPGEPVNPVNSGNALMKLAYFGSDWNSADGGVNLTLVSTGFDTGRYRLRYTVGNQFAYLSDFEFETNKWVDLALVVESPKMSLYACTEMRSWNSNTNDMRFVRTFTTSDGRRPAIAANKRYFSLGSSGDSGTYDTFTYGVAPSASMSYPFRGSIHQFAFWDRALTPQEVREAMGGPALVKVGLTGNKDNLEFTAVKTSVAAEGNWHELNPVLTAANPSATITFPCSKQRKGLPQFLRVVACADSAVGTVGVTLNGEALGTVKVDPAKVGRLYIAAGKIVEGANTLVLTRQDGTTLKLDAVTVDGSWQYGTDEAGVGISYFGRAAEPWDAYNFIPFCGADKTHYRGMGGKSTPYYFHFRVPTDLAGKCKGKLYFRSQNTGGSAYKADVSVNGTVLGTLTFNNSSTGTVKVPAKALKAGWNEAKLQLQGGWANMDCHRFTIEPGGEGLMLLVR